jgi:beta-phosphoglucomutase-like phosphatase (HAD superfamily)
VVEDSDNGARAALAAGLKALVVTLNDYTATHEFDGVPLVVDQLGDSERPARALVGALGDAMFVDLAVLERLHRQTYPIE